MTTHELNMPEFMRYEKGVREESLVFFLEATGREFDLHYMSTQESFNQAILEALTAIDGFEPKPPVLLKVHVGEPQNKTSMRPVFTTSTNSYLMKHQIPNPFFGDTTVLYSGPRGHHQNGPRAESYIHLSKQRGFQILAPFVVLDRPQTSIPGRVEFAQSENIKELDFKGRFKRFSLSGGFTASSSVINHVHLTLHGLTHLALCVKGLTMGLSGRSGKLAMHQCYHPDINAKTCNQCNCCVEVCPESALLEQDGKPQLDSDKCIGCGECMTVCPEEAIHMRETEVADWTKGAASLTFRMVDYLMGLMDGRWESLINIAHLYNITSQCDCVNSELKPICENLGFLVGQNPFAVDYAARQILEEKLAAQTKGKSIKHYHPQDTGQSLFDYVSEEYQVITKPDLVPVRVKVRK